MKKMLFTALLLLGVTWLVFQPVPVLAQGPWQTMSAATDPWAPYTPTTENGTATASGYGQFGSQATFGSQSSASATASANGSGSNPNSGPTAEGKYGYTVTYGWAGMGPPTSYFYLDITASSTASFSASMGGYQPGWAGSSYGSASTNPATVQASSTASSRAGASNSSSPGTTHYQFNARSNSTPTVNIIADSTVSPYIFSGSGTVAMNATAQITVGINPSAN